MRVARITLARAVACAFLLLLLNLTAWRTTLTTTTAQTTAQVIGAGTGLLAVQQAARAGAPAAIRFYTPDAQLVHTLPLPDHAVAPAPPLAPDGRHWAYLTGTVGGPEAAAQNKPLPADLTLHIARTRDGAEVAAIPLLPANFPDNIAANAELLVARDPSLGDMAVLEEAVWQAFRYSLGIFAWSPDGTQLAFSAAIDGPSSDLYLYDTTTQQLTRLTDGIEQIDGLRWSPDGQWIWHSTIAYGYCQACSGHHFAAAADGSAVVTLPGDDTFRFLGWADATTYLVSNGANGPGDFDLQRVDVATGRSETLWAGTHQGFIYDVAANRLGVIGTRGQTYEPDSQVFVVDLAALDDAAGVVEYDDLTSALENEAWLAPLDQRPLNYPCGRAGPIVNPCLETIYDPLSPPGTLPTGTLIVTENYAVQELESGAQLLPRESELAPGGRILWRPDGAGFYITQPNLVVYRELATGDYTVLDNAMIIGWLPHATAATFAAGTPPAPAPVAPAPLASATPHALPYATPIIDVPYRLSTLDGEFPDVATELRIAQARELATIAQSLTVGESYTDKAARLNGLNLLLAHEAAHTYLDVGEPQTLSPGATHPALAPEIETEIETEIQREIETALDTILAATPPHIATYPASGRLASTYAMALSPNGAFVATGDFDGNVAVWEYATGTLLRVLAASTNSIHEIQFSSDSTMLAATDTRGQVTMWYVESGIQSATHVGQYVTTSRIAWRPYTYDLAVSNGDVPLMIHPHSGSAYAFLDPALEATAEALAYSADGTLLAIALDPLYPLPTGGSARQPITPEERPIWIVDASSGAHLHEIEDDRTTYYLAFTPDGSTLVVGSAYRLRAWDVATETLRFEVELPEYAMGWAMTPDGSHLAMLTRQRGVTYYDLTQGASARTLPVDATVLNQLAIHPLDGMLVTTDLKGPPLLIDPVEGTSLFRFGPPRARLATVSPTAPLLATADVNVITLHDLTTQRIQQNLMGAENVILDMAFSLDGQWLAAREESGALVLWDVTRGTLLWRLTFSSEYGGRVAFTADGRIVTGGSDGILRIVNAPVNGNDARVESVPVGGFISALAVSPNNEATVAVGKPRALPLRINLDNLEAEAQPVPATEGREHVHGPLAYSPDGSLLALPRGEGLNFGVTLEVWETATHTRRHAIDLGNIYALTGLAFSPDGRWLATASHDVQPITIWEVASGEKLQELGDLTSTLDTTRLAFDPTGTRLFASESSGITRQFALTLTHALRTIAGHRGGIWDVAVSPNGRWAATAGDDQRVRVWNWESGAQLTQVIAEPERVSSVDFSPTGDAILTGSYAGEVRLYHASGALQQTFTGHTNRVVDAIFRLDGNAFATVSLDGSVAAWELGRAQPSWRVAGLPMGVDAIAYAPDSSLLAGSADGGPNTTIYIWDAYSGEEIMQLHGHGNYVVSLAFSPDGALLASASWDRTIKLWDVASGDQLGSLEGHTDILTDLAFSPDGSQLASIAEDYTLRLWDVVSHAESGRILLPRTLPWAVSYSPDGHALLTTHADGTLRTWLVDPTDSSLTAKMLLAAARVPRPIAQFTASERNQYAIDSYIGFYALSASANINVRPEPYIKSLVVRPATNTSAETLIALTNEKFLLTSIDQGESWRVVTRFPLTRTYHSLSPLARPTDPLLITSEQGLYQVGDDGALTLIHSDAIRGVSYSHTHANELWAVRGGTVYKSEDGGITWGTAANDLYSNELYAPLLTTAPNNNPQLVVGHPLDWPAPVVWRGAGNGFWQRLDNLPYLPSWALRGQGLAWDGSKRTLYLSGTMGELYAATNVDAPNAADVSAAVVERFGPGTRPFPLAAGSGQSLYVNLLTPYGPRTLRGTWDGNAWQWVELRLPLVAAG